MKDAYHYINESLYNYENKFLTNFGFTNLQLARVYNRKQLKDVKIGDFPEMMKEYIYQIMQDLKARTQNIKMNIMTNSQSIALNNELNSIMTKAREQIENNENFKPLLVGLNNAKNILYNMYNKANEYPFIQFLVNHTSSALNSLNNMTISEIEEYTEKTKEKIREETNYLRKINKTTEKIRYIFKYYVEKILKSKIILIKYLIKLK